MSDEDEENYCRSATKDDLILLLNSLRLSVSKTGGCRFDSYLVRNDFLEEFSRK